MPVAPVTNIRYVLKMTKLAIIKILARLVYRKEQHWICQVILSVDVDNDDDSDVEGDDDNDYEGGYIVDVDLLAG